LIRTFVRIAAAVVLTAAVCDAQGQILDVPYLPQTESLCGGAAAAMVMRYWGATAVYADSFADLVDPAAGGIHATDLLRALRDRGWSAESFRGDELSLQRALGARRPAIVLIEDRPARFHYVVILGWTGERVIAHDPARAPFRVLDGRAFMAAWKASGYWTVVPDPPAQIVSSLPMRPDDSAPSAVSNETTPCGGMIAKGVHLAADGDLQAARSILEAAVRVCPGSAAAWRELAGVHALASDWNAAATEAERAIDVDPTDAHAARILATARYLEDDPEGALDAWNRVGEPIIDLVNINGLERTRYDEAARLMDLRPRQMLTRASLEAARRRLAELPSAQAVRISFRPGENARAQVDAVVVERPFLPASPVAAGVAGLHALTEREIAAAISSPSGGGERLTVAWRWWEHRPRIAARFDAPAPFGGLWGVTASHETQSYALSSATLQETRTRVDFHISNWTTAGLRWETELGVDKWDETSGQALSIGGALEQRLARDRASMSVSATTWVGGLHASTMGMRAEWRSRRQNIGGVWLAHAGGAITNRASPFALWSGAGTGQGRDALLRAHPLLHDGFIRGVFGPRLTYGGAEWRQWFAPGARPLRLAPALFLDTARSFDGFPGADERWHYDAGVGLRLAIPGSGVLRFDVAHGLRDGRTAFSMGWLR
jgi:hypothetical protein